MAPARKEFISSGRMATAVSEMSCLSHKHEGKKSQQRPRKRAVSRVHSQRKRLPAAGTRITASSTNAARSNNPTTLRRRRKKPKKSDSDLVTLKSKSGSGGYGGGQPVADARRRRKKKKNKPEDMFSMDAEAEKRAKMLAKRQKVLRAKRRHMAEKLRQIVAQQRQQYPGTSRARLGHGQPMKSRRRRKKPEGKLVQFSSVLPIRSRVNAAVAAAGHSNAGQSAATRKPFLAANRNGAGQDAGHDQKMNTPMMMISA